MAISSYSTLALAAQSFMLDRSDLATPMPDLVMAGEHMIYHGMDDMAPLRCRKMETRVSLTPVSGVCTLPSDYLQWKGVTALSSPHRELDAVAKSAVEQHYGNGSGGSGDVFYIEGDSLYTAPLVSSDVQLVYWALPTALDSTVPTSTNIMLTAYPLLYLRAVQAACCEWLKDFAEMQTQLQFCRSLIRSLNNETTMDHLMRAGTQFRRQVR